MEEPEYRKCVDAVFTCIDNAFESVDPDLAESTISQGALTVLFHEKLRLIVSPQTPVRQIWVAFRDRAWHLDLEPATGLWKDDRGQGIELYSLVESLTLEQTGVTISVARTA
ncbi:MAG: iron donor protein CyaY [Deltaproteobacteria bacterium]|nr:iron donor protein CyaY [Deltaproteobacteria bacterium]